MKPGFISLIALLGISLHGNFASAGLGAACALCPDGQKCWVFDNPTRYEEPPLNFCKSTKIRQDKLNCEFSKTGASLVITENYPGAGEATIESGSDSTVVKYSAIVTDRTESGGNEVAFLKKTFWHPYYSITLEGEIQSGLNRSRVTGQVIGFFDGFLNGEMQKPQALHCTLVR